MGRSRLLFVFSVVLLVVGCQLPPQPGEDSAGVNPGGTVYVLVPTYFATDRDLAEARGSKDVFGGSRGLLRYGITEVSIPHDHERGRLESPSLWRLEFREDPQKHVVLMSTSITSKAAFFDDLSIRLRQSASGSALVFIHGYNVTFAEAARRTAQMSYDLSFPGVPVFYSWPSQGSEHAYTIDAQNIEWTQANLKTFLADLLQRAEVENVYLMAHSMGNRALTRAVAALLTERPELRGKLAEIILTAPDIDADVFRRDLAPLLTAARRPITLYASADDLALAASKEVHGHARAGDAGSGLVLVEGIETIDATGMDTSLLGHSYFAESSSVLSDIYYLVNDSSRAKDRSGLRGVESQAGTYWEFVR